MEYKINELLKNYEIKREKKERIIEPLLQKRSTGEYLSEKETINYHKMRAEIELVDKIIVDLEYVLEQ